MRTSVWLYIQLVNGVLFLGGSCRATEACGQEVTGARLEVVGVSTADTGDWISLCAVGDSREGFVADTSARFQSTRTVVMREYVFVLVSVRFI